MIDGVRGWAVTVAVLAAVPLAAVPRGSPADPSWNVAFAAATYRASERDGMVQLLVRRGGGTSGPVTVHLATADGTAHAGSNYVATNVDLTFAEGEGAEKRVDVPILDDALAEGDETFTATLTVTSSEGAAGSPSTATIRIVDDELPESGPASG